MRRFVRFSGPWDNGNANANPFEYGPKAHEAWKPIRVTRVSAVVSVVGQLAVLETEIHFTNPNGREFETSLDWPLADGASIGGYALDINGQFVDAVPVEKQKAREVFEAEKRKGNGPGLLEQKGGNVYSIRVGQMPANGSRKVKVITFTSLDTLGVDVLLHVPMPFDTKIPEFELEIGVDQSPTTNPPEFVGGSAALFSKAFKFQVAGIKPMASTTIDSKTGSVGELAAPVNCQFLGAARFRDLLPTDIRIRMPDLAKRQQIAISASDQTEDPYFVIHHSVQVGAQSIGNTTKQAAAAPAPAAAIITAMANTVKAAPTIATAPNRPTVAAASSLGGTGSSLGGTGAGSVVAIDGMALVWDASGSRSDRDVKRESEFIDALVSNLGAANSLDVFLQRGVSSMERHRIITSGLKTFLNELVYDGATSFRGMWASLANYRKVLWFTDGMRNLGHTDQETTSPVPLHIFNSNVNSDHSWLRRKASESGGYYYPVNPSLNANQIIQTILSNSSAAEVFSGIVPNADLYDVFIDRPSGGSVDRPSGGSTNAITVCGRFRRDTTLVLQTALGNVSYGLKKKTAGGEIARVTDACRYDVVARYWASQKLLSLPAGDTRAILKLARRYQLATDKTSLLVLERLDQYIEHDICPPTTQPQMRAQYLAGRQQKEKDSTATRLDKATRVLNTMWRVRREWHNTWKNFKPPTKEEEEKAAAAESAAMMASVKGIGTKKKSLERRHSGSSGASTGTGVGRNEDLLQEINCVDEIGGVQNAAMDDDETLQCSAESLECMHEVIPKSATVSNSAFFKKKSGPVAAIMSMFTATAASAPAAPAAPAATAAATYMPQALVAQVASARAPRAAGVTAAASGEMMSDMAVCAAACAPADESDELVARGAPAAAAASTGRGGGEDPFGNGSSTLSATPAAVGATIHLQKWDPTTPYLTELKAVYESYLTEHKNEKEKEKGALTVVDKHYQNTLKPLHSRTSGFFFVISNWMFNVSDKFPAEIKSMWHQTAVRIATNIFEMNFETPQMFRMAAYRVLQAGEMDLALELFESVLRLAPAEAHARLDVACVLLSRFLKNPARDDPSNFDRAVELLIEVVVNPVEDRFRDVEVMALMELNRAVARRSHFGLPTPSVDNLLDLLWHKIRGTTPHDPTLAPPKQPPQGTSTEATTAGAAGPVTTTVPKPTNAMAAPVRSATPAAGTFAQKAPTTMFEDLQSFFSGIETKVASLFESKSATGAGALRGAVDFSPLFETMDADVRVKMQWDTDMTDQALCVTEPHGQRVKYNDTLSNQGGYFFRDFTRGYGPEEYICKHGRKGDYRISAFYWYNHSATLVGETTLLFTITTNWSRPNENTRFVSIMLKKDKDGSASTINDFTPVDLCTLT